MTCISETWKRYALSISNIEQNDIHINRAVEKQHRVIDADLNTFPQGKPWEEAP
jgi:hypothetical protein